MKRNDHLHGQSDAESSLKTPIAGFRHSRRQVPFGTNRTFAGLLGFSGVSIVSADIARTLFYIFVVIFLVLLILGLTVFRV